MKRKCLCLLVAVSSVFTTATSAQAEQVSTKAADLIGTQASNQQSVSQKNFSVAQNIEADDNSKLPEANYWYVSGRGGIGFPSDLSINIVTVDSESINGRIGYGSAFQGAIAAGYQWKQARAELEYAFGSYESKIGADGNSKVNAPTLMVNGYWDISTGSKLRPYIGAGIGVGFPKVTNTVPGEDSNDPELLSANGTSLAIQGKVGIQYEITKKGNIFLELGYKNIGSFSRGGLPEPAKLNYDGVNSSSISVGYRQGF